MDGTVKCPAGHVLKVKSSLRGKQAACPACGTRFIVPAEDASNGQQPPTQQQQVEQPQSATPAASITPVATNPTTAAAPASAPRPAPALASPAWYVADPTGRQVGPLSAEAVEQMLIEGRLAAHWLVWQQGWAAWRAAAEVFVNRLTVSPPQPKPPIMPAAPAAPETATVAASVTTASSSPTLPAIVTVESDIPRSSTRTHVARRRSKDGPLIALCVVLVIALIALVPLVIWAIMRG